MIKLKVEINGQMIPYDEIVKTLIKKFEDNRLELSHSGLGIAGEAGELADALKKVAIYGKPPDMNNIVEEIGDCLFFLTDIMNKFNIPFPTVLQRNAVKLKDRYPKGYSDQAAITRADKSAESEPAPETTGYKLETTYTIDTTRPV